jgi:hypothetical protein
MSLLLLCACRSRSVCTAIAQNDNQSCQFYSAAAGGCMAMSIRVIGD